MNETLTDRKGRAMKRISLQKRVELRRLYVAEMPRWRRPLVGYLTAFPIVGLGLLVLLLEQLALPSSYFVPGTPLLIATLVVALFWGVGPALLSVALGTICLDYFYVSPYMGFNILSAQGILQLLPYIVAGLVIAVIIAQREGARYRALDAEQVANAHADELARANAELEQATQLKDQFFSMASHELKTPITSIRGQAQLALRRMAKERTAASEVAEVRTALEAINEQTRRLNALVGDLLDLSSIRAGKIPLHMGKCDLAQLCRAVVEEQRLLSGRAVELTVPAEPVIIEADGERLSQVVTNLVNNALKYSPEASAVLVRLSQASDQALIEVQDEGPGIAKGELQNIFEPFYRATHTRKSSQNGMGLGLAICRDIVERHGGSIWCESSPGRGSIFFVKLPSGR